MSRKEVAVLPRFGKTAALVGIVAVTVSGCSVDEVLRFGWPVGVTPEAEMMRELWTWSVIAALAVGVLVWGLIFWAVAFHRKRKNDDSLPRQFQYNVPLELFAVALPTVMVCVLFFFTVTTETDVIRSEVADPDVTIDVTAFQWNWEFAYPDNEMPDGEPVRTVGNSAEIPLLVLPTDQRIEFTIKSTDVIHAFWVPDFLFKRDVMPRPEKNNQDYTFQVTEITEEGAFVGRCAELCGTYHSVMNFEVRALSPELYEKYLGLRTSGLSASEALAKMDCGKLCTPTAITTKPFNTERTARTGS